MAAHGGTQSVQCNLRLRCMHDAADDREMNIIALCRPIQQRVPRRRLPRHQRCGRVGAIAEEIAFAINMNARREGGWVRSEEHTSELQSIMRISYAVFCLKKKKTHTSKRTPP